VGGGKRNNCWWKVTEETKAQNTNTHTSKNKNKTGELQMD
jgi:hypothetical protein